MRVYSPLEQAIWQNETEKALELARALERHIEALQADARRYELAAAEHRRRLAAIETQARKWFGVIEDERIRGNSEG